MSILRVSGMQGLGDNLHERAIVKALMARQRVELETPWPCVFHDLVGARLRLVDKGSTLRTQAKNAAREAAKFSAPIAGSPGLRVWYTHEGIRKHGSFLAAMAAHCNVTVTPGDFALPIAPEWRRRADELLARWRPQRPLALYRPLVERQEWPGCAGRNPDHAAYAAIFRAIRGRFFVVSVADLEPGREWAVGEDIGADVECHRGELEFEALAALAARAGLVYCSPGFAIILAQAVDAPLIAVFGGHEAARFYDHGNPRQLFVQPVVPCECFSHSHRCDKRIDTVRAIGAVRAFVNELDQQPCAA